MGAVGAGEAGGVLGAAVGLSPGLDRCHVGVCAGCGAPVKALPGTLGPRL